MEFPGFLGNEALKSRLSSALSKGKLSHSYLISGPAGSGKHTLAQLLAAAMECTADAKPCGHCSQCRKVFGSTHPDIITVDDTEHKTIPVKLVRDACADLYIRPNEGAKKIYLFPRAQDLNLSGQNALLKIMEEPPAYGVFLLLTDQPEHLLPTIRSRCAELRLAPLSERVLSDALLHHCPEASPEARQSAVLRSGGYLGKAIALLKENAELLPQSKTFLQALGNREQLLYLLAPMEKLKRDQIRPIFLQWLELTSSALACRNGQIPIDSGCQRLAQDLNTAYLLRVTDALKEAIALTDANVGIGHICGALSILLQA